MWHVEDAFGVFEGFGFWTGLCAVLGFAAFRSALSVHFNFGGFSRMTFEVSFEMKAPSRFVAETQNASNYKKIQSAAMSRRTSTNSCRSLIFLTFGPSGRIVMYRHIKNIL